MRQLVGMVAITAAMTAAFAQDGSIHEVKFKYEKAIRRIAGVLDVTVGGLNGQMRIIVRVENAESRDAVQALVGEKLDGFAVHIMISSGAAAPAPATTTGASSTCSSCACPCHKRPGQTVAETRPPPTKFELDRINDPTYTAEQCDVIRQVLGMPERPAKNGIRCTQMLGTTNDPAKIAWVRGEGLPCWESKELGGQFVAYTYIKHRQFCPKGMKQLLADIDRLTPGQ